MQAKRIRKIFFTHIFALLACLYKYPPPGQRSTFREAIKAFIKIKIYMTSSGFPPTLHTAGQLRRARIRVKFPLFSSLTTSWWLIDCDGLFYALHVLFCRSVLALSSVFSAWCFFGLCCCCWTSNVYLSAQNLTFKHLPAQVLHLCFLNHLNHKSPIPSMFHFQVMACASTCTKKKHSRRSNWILEAWPWIDAFACVDLSALLSGLACMQNILKAKTDDQIWWSETLGRRPSWRAAWLLCVWPCKGWLFYPKEFKPNWE